MSLPARQQAGGSEVAPDPLVHHSHHFGRAMHAFCNVQTLLTNGIVLMSEVAIDDESLTAVERKEYALFKELLRMVPGLEACLMTSSKEEIMLVGELVQKGINDARADDMKGMKRAIIDWITPKGQSLNPHIPRNVKTRMKLVNGQIQVAGDQWLIFLYVNYTYNTEDPWNGLLRSGLLISISIIAFKHIFTSPSSVDQEPKATHSGNARIHGMQAVTKASIGYVATQTCFALTSAQVFSHTDLITDSEHFHCSIVELLEDPEEKDEVDQLLMWWNRQIFPLYLDLERLPSKDSVLARICQKHTEYRERTTLAT
ncbi:hypothetical protein BDN67DRAFT_992770 [Paxillus ammoniavirescens]|nr:hypothetical protein BDN67DRAFT_992770 [Paxillus ammoniavirescens]